MRGTYIVVNGLDEDRVSRGSHQGVARSGERYCGESKGGDGDL